VKTIAESVGFDYVCRLSRDVKRECGVTPAAFRKPSTSASGESARRTSPGPEPPANVKALIRNASAFRAGSKMPAMDLTNDEMDDVLAYLKDMSPSISTISLVPTRQPPVYPLPSPVIHRGRIGEKLG
jgi:hypothetical protein